MLLGIAQGVMISEAPGENPGKAIRESTHSGPSHVQYFTTSYVLREFSSLHNVLNPPVKQKNSVGRFLPVECIT